jgi:hypothetical protein
MHGWGSPLSGCRYQFTSIVRAQPLTQVAAVTFKPLFQNTSFVVVVDGCRAPAAQSAGSGNSLQDLATALG